MTLQLLDVERVWWIVEEPGTVWWGALEQEESQPR